MRNHRGTAESQQAGADVPSRQRREDWASLFLVLAIFFIVGGTPAPHVNETHYLTKAKHYWDPSYAPGDLFLDSADPHLAFYWTVGWLTKWLSLPVVAWVGRAAAWALLAWGWLRLVRAVFDSPWAAPLSAALWLVLINRGNFAGEWVVGGVEAKCFAYAFVLAGLAAMARGRWTSPWIWFGLASAMHVLVGAWAVVAGLAVWATEPRGGRASVKRLLPGLIVGGLISLFGLLPALALERGVDTAVASEASRIYVFDRLPHHLAPLSLKPEELAPKLARFGLLCAAMVALWALARRKKAPGASRGLEPRRDSLADPRLAPGAFLSSCDAGVDPCVALNRVFRFAAAALAANGAGLLIEAVLSGRPDDAARILRYYWFRQADVVVPLAVALAAVSLALSLARRGLRWGGAAIAAIALWSGVELLLIAADRWQSPIPPADVRISGDSPERFAAWRDACQWVNDHAPADAVFLIPRSGQSFKWYAGRADAANWKDVPQDAAGVVQWRARCEQLFPKSQRFGKPTTLDSPEKLGAERLRELADEYGATHVLAAAYPPLDLPVAYAPDPGSADSFTVYELRGNRSNEAP